ncbi:NADH-cytochrome b5 reductase [Hypoxylon texense]
MSDTPVKVPPEDAPFPLTEVDKWVLSLTDEEYQYHDWEDMKKVIRENNLSVLKRKPSDLRRYMEWTAETKAEYGSMTTYLIKQRLPKTWGSPPFTSASVVPFDDPSDYRVLINDWPYGLTPDLAHIVVWSRTTIETDPETGDMTPESRKIIEDFVKRFFIEKLGPGGNDKVLWFKNWVALQSVRALEHIHIIVKDVEKDVLDEWTKELDCHRLVN